MWYRIIRAGGVALVLGGLSAYYQHTSKRIEREAETEARIGTSALQIQVALEQLSTPCLLESDGACAARFASLLRELSSGIYAFRDDARRTVTEQHVGKPVLDAIGFIDDFYNPGQEDFARMGAQPLQVELLRQQAWLSRRARLDTAPGGWCSDEGRARMRALLLSSDTFRYCYGFARRRVSGVTTGPLEKDSRYELCTGERSFVERTNAIVARIGSLDSADYSAPWLYDGPCAAKQHLGGGVAPRDASALVIASGGSASLFVRDAGAWKLERTTAVRGALPSGPTPLLPLALGVATSALYRLERDADRWRACGDGACADPAPLDFVPGELLEAVPAGRGYLLITTPEELALRGALWGIDAAR